MPEQDCIFCKIAAGEIPAQLVHEDDRAVAFRDINPQAPTHILVIPREHVAALSEAEPGHEALLGHLLLTAARVARSAGLSESGFAPSSTTAPAPARASSTSTSTSSADAASPGRRARGGQKNNRRDAEGAEIAQGR